MATKHWARDVLLNGPGAATPANNPRANALLFHFLRTAGFDWLWECGNEHANSLLNPNYVDDGAMAQVGTAKWTATGAATIAKVTTPVNSGTQALSVDPTAGAGGVRSAAMAANAPIQVAGNAGESLSGPDATGIMTFTGPNSSWGSDSDAVGQEFEMVGSSNPTNNGRFPVVAWVNSNQVKFYNPNGVAEIYTALYTVSTTVRAVMMTSMWVSNNTGTLNVSVDRGDGTPVVVGTIPNNGGTYTRYNFSWSYQGVGSAYVYVENPSSGSAFYIDSIITWRSAYEYYAARDEAVASPDTSHYAFTNNLAANHYGVDGALTNPDQFSTGAGDNYSPGADDVGKHLFIWDGTNNKNSGIYEIIANVGGGVVQVSLRSTTAAFTTTTGLKWRIVNIQQFQATGGAGTFGNVFMPEWIKTAGYGLESPHTSSWRFFLRQNQNDGSNVRSTETWSAPEDTDFSQDDGHFYRTGPSVMKNRAKFWTRNISGGGTTPYMHSWRSGGTIAQTRIFMMTDANLSFFAFLCWDNSGSNNHDTYFVGYHDANVLTPGIMAFMHMSKWESVSGNNGILFTGSTESAFIEGTSFDDKGFAKTCCVAQQQYRTGGGSYVVLEQANAQANQWSGEEQLQQLRLVNDPFGSEAEPSERDAGDGIGIWQGRTNLTAITPFDSNNYIHFYNGFVWEWSGETLGP